MQSTILRRALTKNTTTTIRNIRNPLCITQPKRLMSGGGPILHSYISYGEIAEAKSRQFGLSDYPTTPITSTQRTVIKSTRAVLDVAYLSLGVIMLLFVSSPLWADFQWKYQQAKFDKKYAEVKDQIS